MKPLDFVQIQLTENKSLDSYLFGIRASIRGLYKGEFSLFQFVDNMVGTVERNLIIAWNDGARDCGIRPNEMSQDELLTRDRYINNQFRYILPLGQKVIQDRDIGRKITQSLSRANPWANRWRDMRALGSQTVCADLKMLWRWDPRKEHCCDCENMNGRVYRNSTWARYGIRPGSSSLACFGGYCGCTLNPTNLPATPGRPPGLRGPGGCK